MSCLSPRSNWQTLEQVVNFSTQGPHPLLEMSMILWALSSPEGTGKINWGQRCESAFEGTHRHGVILTKTLAKRKPWDQLITR